MANVFLLGAGFSKAISPLMPVLSELGEAVRTRVDFGTGDVLEGDFELQLSYLVQGHPGLPEAVSLRNRALALDASRFIAAELGSRVKAATALDCPAWLPDLVRWWHADHSTVITLNYDDLVERAAMDLKVPHGKDGKLGPLRANELYPVVLTPLGLREAGVLGGDEVDSFSLIKLHGSVNWFYSGSSSYFGETIYWGKVGGWKPENEWERRHGRHVADKVPLIVPPVADKATFFQNETIRSLWFQAGVALRSATSLFVIGYSLPTTDLGMRFLLHSSCPEQPVTLYLVNSDSCSIEHFGRMLPHPYYIDARYVSSDACSRLSTDLASGKLIVSKSK